MNPEALGGFLDSDQHSLYYDGTALQHTPDQFAGKDAGKKSRKP
jgi:hypothetical protein